MENIVDQQNSAASNKLEARISRSGFLLGILYISSIFLIPLLAQLIVRSLLSTAGESSPNTLSIISLVFGIVGVILVLPVSIYLYIRRLHDVNQTGLLTFITLIPLVNLLLFLYLVFTPGTNGPNSYGLPVNSNNFWVVIGLKNPK